MEWDCRLLEDSLLIDRIDNLPPISNRIKSLCFLGAFTSIMAVTAHLVSEQGISSHKRDHLSALRANTYISHLTPNLEGTHLLFLQSISQMWPLGASLVTLYFGLDCIQRQYNREMLEQFDPRPNPYKPRLQKIAICIEKLKQTTIFLGKITLFIPFGILIMGCIYEHSG